MAFKMKGSPMKRNFGVGASPMKQSKTTTYTYSGEEGEEKKKKVTTETGRENKKGQSQQDVMDQRWKNLVAAANAADAGIINRDGKQVTQDMFDKASKKHQEAMLKDQKALIDMAKHRMKQFQHSADSIGNVNQIIDDQDY